MVYRQIPMNQLNRGKLVVWDVVEGVVRMRGKVFQKILIAICLGIDRYTKPTSQTPTCRMPVHFTPLLPFGMTMNTEMMYGRAIQTAVPTLKNGQRQLKPGSSSCPKFLQVA